MRLFAAIVAVITLMWANSASAQVDQLYMLDFVFMSKGHTLADRDKHNQKARPIASRYGVNLVASLDALARFAGPKGLARLDIWTLPNQSALSSWGADTDYKKIEPNARKIHDFKQLTLYLSRERVAPQIVSGNIYYVELLTFNQKNFSVPELVGYIKNNDQIAKEYGLIPAARFNPISRILGNGPKANLLNVYSVQSKTAFKKLSEDKRYRALNPVRKKLFETDKMLIGVFKAN